MNVAARLERALGILSLQYSPERPRHWLSLVVAGKVGLLAVRTVCQMYFPTTARRTMNMVTVTTSYLTVAILCPATTGHTGSLFMFGWSSCFDKSGVPLSRDRGRADLQAGAVQGYQRARHPQCGPGLRTCLRPSPGRPGRGRHRRPKHHLSGKCVRNIPVQLDQVGEKSRDFRHHLSRR